MHIIADIIDILEKGKKLPVIPTHSRFPRWEHDVFRPFWDGGEFARLGALGGGATERLRLSIIGSPGQRLVLSANAARAAGTRLELQANAGFSESGPWS